MKLFCDNHPCRSCKDGVQCILPQRNDQKGEGSMQLNGSSINASSQPVIQNACQGAHRQQHNKAAVNLNHSAVQQQHMSTAHCSQQKLILLPLSPCRVLLQGAGLTSPPPARSPALPNLAPVPTRGCSAKFSRFSCPSPYPTVPGTLPRRATAPSHQHPVTTPTFGLSHINHHVHTPALAPPP